MYISHWLYNQLVKDVCNHRLDVTVKPARKENCFISGFVRIVYPLECFLVIKGHASLDRNPGSGYTTLILCMILQDFTLHVNIESSTHIFMMVFGMTKLGREPTIYHTRDRQANNKAILPHVPCLL